ncbi:hypothetical protein QCB44_10200 [Thiomicrorhabdus sp. zzn3]|uniref:hypothetical protein n=1 Tax=Thiomicrorhabdus sp. zzn3 TaxID=3039775 RepID=UPI0024366FAB|nr:hypothetical protein [Thiomicrorhabdus sp. zzn3]MDG6779076.1 hypothetical protein [Thiomicrorhabdus sp. zzn3]
MDEKTSRPAQKHAILPEPQKDSSAWLFWKLQCQLAKMTLRLQHLRIVKANRDQQSD